MGVHHRARVLHVLPDLAPGGGQIVVATNAQHVDTDRFDVRVCYLLERADLRADFETEGIAVDHIGHRRGAGARTIWRLVRLIRVQRIDLVHVHSDLDRTYAQAAALLTRTPVVGHLHAEWNHLAPRVAAGHSRVRARAASWFRNRIERAVVRRYVATSEHVRNVFATRLGDVPIAVLPPTVDVAPFDAVDRPDTRDRVRGELAVARSVPVVTTVSRLVAGKGHERVLHAFAAVRRRHPEAVLVVVGDGPLRRELQRCARRLAIDDAVRFTGHRRDVPELLAASDLFVFASASEGFGLAVLEAMAASRPVVAFDLPALREFIEPGVTAELVSPTDDEAFAGAIIELLSAPARAKAMGAAGRCVVVRDFDPDRTGRSMAALYEAVLAENTHRSALAGRLRPTVRAAWRRLVRLRARDVTASLAGRSVLVVAPHPDDETLGCGGLIARLVAEGVPVEVAVVTDGRASHPSSTIDPARLAEVRAAECLAATARLGLTPDRVHQLAIEEGALSGHVLDLEHALHELVDRTAATDVFVPCALDWHPDHRLVNDVVARVVAGRAAVRVLEYPVWFWADGPWLPHHETTPAGRAWRYVADPVLTLWRLRTVLVRTSDEHRVAKRDAMAEYRSQVSNLTGEPSWATLGDRFLEDFLGDSELFFVGGGA